LHETSHHGTIIERKIAEVLCIYREVEVLKKAHAKSNKGKSVAIMKTPASRPSQRRLLICLPNPASIPTFARDHEYKRHGTLSLLAGIDLLTGKVHAPVKDRHHSREFIEFLKLLPPIRSGRRSRRSSTIIPHILKETKAWLATRPTGRFELTFTPDARLQAEPHRGFFSKLTRSVLRHIRVTSKIEL
jgi:hypothetical protein